KYAYTRWSVAKSRETASPSRPPSPPGETPGTVPTTVVRPSFAATLTIRPVSREATSRSPSGSATTPHGALSPVATVPVTSAEPFAGAAGPAGSEADGAEALVAADAEAAGGTPPSEEHPVASSAAPASAAVTTAARRPTLPSRGFSGTEFKNITSVNT